MLPCAESLPDRAAGARLIGILAADLAAAGAAVGQAKTALERKTQVCRTAASQGKDSTA